MAQITSERSIPECTGMMVNLVLEAETFFFYKTSMQKQLRENYVEYQTKKIDYFKYKTRNEKILKGKNEKEWMDYYDNYLYGILKRIEELNSEIFYLAYNEKSWNMLKLTEPIEKE